jgi:hypothetical protein
MFRLPHSNMVIVEGWFTIPYTEEERPDFFIVKGDAARPEEVARKDVLGDLPQARRNIPQYNPSETV